MPNDLLARNEFRYLLFGTVHIFVTVRELGAEFVGVALDFSRPPSRNVVDRSEDFVGRLVDPKRNGVISIFMNCSPISA